MVLGALTQLGCSPTNAGALAATDGGAPSSDAGAAATNAGPPIARFSMPTNLADLDGVHFFDHPWPSDFRLESDGSVRVGAFPNPHLVDLFSVYATQTKGLIVGFSPVAAGYVSFTAPIDPSRLPADELASTQPSSALQLVDVDPKSPTFGARRPIQWSFRAPIGDYYTTTNVLSWAPMLGDPLREGGRYALVVTTDVLGLDGSHAAPSAELAAVIAGEGALGAAWKPAIDALAMAGISRDRIAQLAVFSTNDPVGELDRVAAAARALPPPTVTDVVLQSSAADGSYDRYFGHYAGSPNYQAGVAPYSTDGGGFVFDASGKPLVQNVFTLRYLLIVPSPKVCPMPPGGYPLVLYAHGTGGNYADFDADGTGAALAGQCVASMGIDEIFHGERPGAPSPTDPDAESKIELDFFNFGNAVAARTNPRQAAIDELARAAMAAAGGLDVPASVAKSGSAIHFDASRIGFFGHSQGGLNGPMLMAVDDQTKGGVLSGAGSTIAYSLLMKTQPEPSVAGLVAAILAIDSSVDEALTPLHPAMSMVQTVIDPADAVHYYPHIAHAPRAGHTRKSVLMTEGVNPDGSGDHFAPPRTIESSAIAGWFPLVAPPIIDVPELTKVRGLAPLPLPIVGDAPGVAVGLAQFQPPPGVEGHFVAFQVPAARALAARFCRSMLGDAAPTIGAGP
jgi:hypothetical protein